MKPFASKKSSWPDQRRRWAVLLVVVRGANPFESRASIRTSLAPFNQADGFS